MPGYLTQRLVHVHPLLLCNLKCAHCYSSSAPRLRSRLPAGLLVRALEDLRGAGYQAVSLSGGEPFLYEELEALVEGVKEADYSLSVVTNGTLLSRKGAQSILPLFDFIAVSIDGSPPNHDRMRASKGAFARAEQGIDVLAQAQIAFGITFCVTRATLEDIPWVHDFARRKGARLLNLRPLAPIGRGKAMASEFALTPADQARLFLTADLLDGCEGDPCVRVDLVPVGQVLEHKLEAFPVLDPDRSPLALQASDWLNPLVIDESGRVLPFAYGIDPAYALGNVQRDVGRLIGVDNGKRLSLQNLLSTALGELERSDRLLVDWFELVTAVSRETVPVPAASNEQGEYG